MPSFTRRVPTSTPIPPQGTSLSPSTSLPLLPTGVPSLDDLFAGGIPLGGLWLVFASDTHSAWARLLARYWIAQGLISGQDVVIVDGTDRPTSAADDADRIGRELVRGCMWVDEREARAATGGIGAGAGAGSESEGEDAGMGEGKGGKKIAWRYDGLSKFRTTVGRSRFHKERLALQLAIPTTHLACLYGQSGLEIHMCNAYSPQAARTA